MKNKEKEEKNKLLKNYAYFEIGKSIIDLDDEKNNKIIE